MVGVGQNPELKGSETNGNTVGVETRGVEPVEVSQKGSRTNENIVEVNGGRVEQGQTIQGGIVEPMQTSQRGVEVVQMGSRTSENTSENTMGVEDGRVEPDCVINATGVAKENIMHYPGKVWWNTIGRERFPISRNGPYIGGHLVYIYIYFFQIEFLTNLLCTKNRSD